MGIIARVMEKGPNLMKVETSCSTIMIAVKIARPTILWVLPMVRDCCFVIFNYLLLMLLIAGCIANIDSPAEPVSPKGALFLKLITLESPQERLRKKT